MTSVTLPRRILFRGKPARVVEYKGDRKFLIVDSNDAYRVVTNQQIIFLKEGSK